MNQKPLETDPAMKQYFNTLPPFVQENIKQSGVNVVSVEELRRCAENLTKSQQ